MFTKRWMMVIVGLFILAFVQPAAAKGPIAKVAITGMGIRDTLEITKRVQLDELSMTGLADFQAGTIPTPDVRIGYLMVRYMQEDEDKLFAFDKLIYFPGTGKEAGKIFYIGLGDNGWSQYDGKWYAATTQADAVLQKMLRPLMSNPRPTAPNIGAVPENCVGGSQYDSAAALPNPALRVASVAWVTGFQGKQPTLKLEDSKAHPMSEQQLGWGADLTWFLENDAYVPITVWGSNLETNQPVWFVKPDNQFASILILARDAMLPADKSAAGFVELPTRIVVPEAGCYKVEAAWGSHSASVVFAAGGAK